MSTRPGGCGGADIYISREVVHDGWAEPQNLGCGINSSADEASSFVVAYDNGIGEFFFSSTRAGGYSPEPPGAAAGDSDLYVCPIYADGTLGAPDLGPGVNTPDQDARPHVRHDGLEILFDSTRAGSALAPNGTRSFDVWSATRPAPFAAWSTPVNLGNAINTGGNETRAFLSWDARTLYFGSTGVPSRSSDIYVSTRQHVTGKDG